MIGIRVFLLLYKYDTGGICGSFFENAVILLFFFLITSIIYPVLSFQKDISQYAVILA